MISSVAAQLARAYGAIDRFLAAQLVEARRQVGASRAAQSVSAHETLTGTAIKAATQAATTAQELKRITPPAKVPLLDLGTARASDLQRATFPLVVPLVGAGSLVVAGPLTASLPIFSEALWLSTVASWPGALELIAFDPAMRGWFGPYSAAAQDHPTAQAQLAANGDQLADRLSQVETSARA
ncbi:MAG: hypothetical protein LBO75_05490, partial [Bifidobacteriaceae bacterium]|nr:hypothetical protein [Bifidobacteriaceae bacterium]